MSFKVTLGRLKKTNNFEIINYNTEKTLNNFSTIEDANKNSIVFVEKESFKKELKNKKVGLIITKHEIEDNHSPQIVVDNPRKIFFNLVKNYIKKDITPGISNKADIGKNCSIADSAYIGPFVILDNNVTIGENVIICGNNYIGANSSIDKNTVINPLVSIYNDVKIGKRCILHSGVVIGSDGYGYDDNNKELIKIPQIGNVFIEDNVEIGANCTIDRATLGQTLIENNVKIDNLVQIAHNVVIKKNTRIAAQSGIAGSSQLGRWVVLAGQVGIGDHVKIGDNVVLTAQSGTAGDINDSGVYSGTPARKMKKYYRVMAYQSKLEKMWKKIKKLEKKIESYEKDS